MKKAKGSKGLQGRACVCVCAHVCPGELPVASRGLQNLQGSPGASRGVCACVRESLQGPSGGSRSLQGPPRACVCVCVCVWGRPPGASKGLPQASRALSGPPGTSRGLLGRSGVQTSHSRDPPSDQPGQSFRAAKPFRTARAQAGRWLSKSMPARK